MMQVQALVTSAYIKTIAGVLKDEGEILTYLINLPLSFVSVTSLLHLDIRLYVFRSILGLIFFVVAMYM